MNIIIAAVSIIAVIDLVSVIVVVELMNRAVEGYEDGEGFHYGKPKGRW